MKGLCYVSVIYILHIYKVFKIFPISEFKDFVTKLNIKMDEILMESIM